MLIQESAYESLLFKERREIHERVADAYERLYPDRLDEIAALLARHYGEAGDAAKTYTYAVRAGDAAARMFAYPEAGDHYAHALEALKKLPDTDDYRTGRADTLLRYIGVSLRAQGPVATLRRLVHAERLARPLAEREGATREDRLRLARVQYWRGQALIHQNEMHAAIKQLDNVLQVARSENDPSLLAMPASVIGRTLVAQGQFADALPILTDAIQALEEIHDRHELVLAIGFRGVARVMLGQYAAGLGDAERALAYASEAKTLTGMAFAHGALGMAYLFGNELPTAIRHARAMIDCAARSGDRLYAYTAFGFLAWADARASACADAERDFGHAHAIADEIGGRLLFADWFAAARAEYILRCGRAEKALTLAGTVSQRARRNGCVFAEGIAERIRGQALAALDVPRLDGALVHLKTSLTKLEEGRAKVEAARTRVALAQVLVKSGDVAAARAQLEQAAAQFRDSGLNGEMKQAKRRMGLLPATVGTSPEKRKSPDRHGTAEERT